VFAAIHFTAWRFVVAIRRDLLFNERLRLFWGCVIADSVLSVASTAFVQILLWRENGELTPADMLIQQLEAILIDFALVGAIVFLTVPWATKRWAHGVRHGHPE